MEPMPPMPPPPYAPQQPRPMSLAEHLANEIGQRAARYIVNVAEDSFWYGCGKVADTYRYFVPLTAAQMRARALFGRREFDGFIAKALERNDLSIVLPAHRVSEALRGNLLRDGYTIDAARIDDVDALRIGFAPQGATLPRLDAPKAGNRR